MLYLYTPEGSQPVWKLLSRVQSAWHDVHVHVVLHYRTIGRGGCGARVTINVLMWPKKAAHVITSGTHVITSGTHVITSGRSFIWLSRSAKGATDFSQNPRGKCF